MERYEQKKYICKLWSQCYSLHASTKHITYYTYANYFDKSKCALTSLKIGWQPKMDNNVKDRIVHFTWTLRIQTKYLLNLIFTMLTKFIRKVFFVIVSCFLPEFKDDKCWEHTFEDSAPHLMDTHIKCFGAS